jgi:hypothetical protein
MPVYHPAPSDTEPSSPSHTRISLRSWFLFDKSSKDQILTPHLNKRCKELTPRAL